MAQYGKVADTNNTKGDGLHVVPALSSLRESPKAAAAFHEYCLLGPDRSLAKLAQSNQRYAKRIPVLKRWSAHHHWQDRVREYDAQEAEKRRKKNAEAIDRMNEEQALIGRTHLLHSIQAMELPLRNNEAPFPSLVSLFKYSAELERLARGAATSRTEGDVSLIVQPKEYINIDPSEEGSIE